jgi:FkbM family methyltransferase
LKFSIYDLVPAYDFVQNVVEHHLHEYLKRERTAIASIYIVGGYRGHEIHKLLSNYPNCHITVFEPSERYKAALEQRFRDEPRVQVIKAAVSNHVGTATFFETSLKGSGSLLPVGELAEQSYGAKQAEKFMVETITLDTKLSGAHLDCLWIDVQGAEHLVLRGAASSLHNIDAVFLEVSRLPNLYDGGATMKQLEFELEQHGFESILVGLDAGNLTGNAFYIRSPEKLKSA